MKILILFGLVACNVEGSGYWTATTTIKGQKIQINRWGCFSYTASGGKYPIRCEDYGIEHKEIK